MDLFLWQEEKHSHFNMLVCWHMGSTEACQGSDESSKFVITEDGCVPTSSLPFIISARPVGFGLHEL